MKTLVKNILKQLGYRISRNGNIPSVKRIYRPRFDHNAFAIMSPQLQELIEWRPQALKTQSAIRDTLSGAMWAEIPLGHKWIDYFKIYDREFGSLRSKQCRVLEIGVYKGASLKLWHQFFGDNATIVGIDINEDCHNMGDPKKNIHVRIGSQTDSMFLKGVVREFGPFDLIIDDGSHYSSHQITSFNELFHEGLTNGGIYFIEDLECAYWGDVTGHLDQNVSIMDFLKTLIDLQNAVYRNRSYNDFAEHSGTVKEQFSVPRIVSLLDSIIFYDSVVVIRKCQKSPPIVLHI